MTREEFMEAYREDDELNESLTPDDCVEVFLSILKGSSDITKSLLETLLREYEVSNLKIVEIDGKS